MSTLWAIFAVADLVAILVCYQKGKHKHVLVGLVALVPPLTFFLVIVPVIGALTESTTRVAGPRPHPSQTQPFTPAGSSLPPPPPPPAATSVSPTSAGSSPSAASSPRPSDPNPTSAIRLFLKDAAVDGVIDRRTYEALLQRLLPAVATTQAPSEPVAEPTPKAPPIPPPPPPVRTVSAPPSASPPTSPAPRVTTGPAPTQPSAPAPVRRPSADALARMAPPPPPPPPPPPAPKEPSWVVLKAESMWEAFTSDVAVHGFVYLGVLLTFISVLGFMLFAFEDLPISAKPFVEFSIVLIFFGWAWLLRIQNARRVAQAMELLGGAILPLVWFAALVDSAGVPPDVDGDPLILALTLSCLGIAGAYWLISRRFENSMLRFLVWPMVWVAAMAVGFIFKTDEHLAGDAITRLVAPQPAFALVAIAATLGFLTWRPASRLAEPTFRAAIVGIPSAYALTFGLSLADASEWSWTMIVAGIGAVASVELVARRFAWLGQLQAIRPYVYALVGAPFVIAVGPAWGGAAVAIGYLILTELAIRSSRPGLVETAGAAGGVAVGVLLSSIEPAPMVVAWGALSIWAHVRRRIEETPPDMGQAVAAVAAAAPVGLLIGLLQLLTVPAALTVAAVLVIAATFLVRMYRSVDLFDSIWFPSAASVLGVIAVGFWVVEGTSAVPITAVLVLAATTVALGQRWPTGNLWLAATHLALATAVLLGAADVQGAGLALAWSSAGLLVILMSAVTHGGRRLRVAPGHLTTLGHAVGLLAFAAIPEPPAVAVAMCGWALGWVVSLLVDERRGAIDSFSTWTAALSRDEDATFDLDNVRAVATTPITAMTVAAAAAAVFVEVTNGTEQLAWLGPTLGIVAVGYALAARLWFAGEFGRIVFAWGGAVLAVASLGLAWLEPWATIASATVVLVVRFLLVGVQRLLWLTWVSWLMPAAAATALGAITGVPDVSLPAVALGVAMAMLLLSLWTDEVRGGRRSHGEFIRTEWLIPPTVLGALLAAASMALLWILQSDASAWASCVGLLGFAVASIMLRRSAWLTATLGSLSLALGMYAVQAPSPQSAAVWGALGLATVLVAPLVAKNMRDDVAGIGHAVGAISFVYLDNLDTAVPVLSMWAIGWLAAVASFELGGPSVSRVLERGSRRLLDRDESWFVEASRALPPIMAVVTPTATALLVYDAYIGFDDARAWASAVVSGLGLLYAMSARLLVSTKPARTILGWSAVGLASAGVVVAIGEPLPIVVTATTFIGIRLLLIGVLANRWLSWPAWVMPYAVVMAAGYALGVPAQSTYILSLAAGVVMLIGSLVVDDVQNGRRATLEGLRTPWLRYPFALGLLAVPLSLAPVFALDATTVGVTSLIAAAGYAAVAVLLKAGSVTFPAIGLAVFGTAVLLPRSSAADPWILVAMAGAIVAWAFIAERIQDEASASNPWTRWDLPALVAAHVVVGVALLLTFDGSLDPVTWVGAGALSMVVGFWRSNRWWIDGGLGLMIVGSASAGEPWLMLVLAATAARGMYGVWRGEGIERLVDHGIAVAGFLALWIDIAVQMDWTNLEIVSFGSATAGMVAAVIAAASRFGLVNRDTFVVWSALGVAGVSVAMVAAWIGTPSGFDGPWAGLGIVLVAVATEQWARDLHRNARFATPAIAALGWLFGMAGLDVSRFAAASATVALFGAVLALLSPIAKRLSVHAVDGDARYATELTRTWAVVMVAGLAVASSVGLDANATEGWWLVAASSAFVTVAVATGQEAFGIPRLRTATGIPALMGLVAALLAVEAPPLGIGLTLLAVASISTLVVVILGRRERDSEWTATSLLTALASVALAVPAAIVERPATDLVVLILIIAGAQAIAFGLVFERRELVALGPPILGLATLTLIVDSAPSSVVWYTVPIGIVMLAEADLLHPILSREPHAERHMALLVLEWSGVALIGLPPLVEMFRTNLMFGLAGFGLGVGLMAWALLTKVKRRLLAAAIVATFSVVLSLAATGASNVQESAAFWIIGGGIGVSIMLVAGTIEAFRSRSGAFMKRLGDLMEEWE